MQTKSLSAPSIGLAALTVGVLLLTGCTQPSPTPSATVTSSETPTSTSPTASAAATAAAPKDSAEAIAAATAVTKEYWAVTDQILNDGGKNPERVDAVSTGAARTYVHDAAAQVLAKGVSVGGSRAVSVTQSYASDATPPGGATIKNGFVGLTVCNDISGSKPLNADGTPGNKGDVMRAAENIEVTYDPAVSKWTVSNYILPTGAVISC
ncbi:hypothetical protein [Paenarthrobacter nitroguajacolicus]|uniref:hypothetical protein n=1 Tax=Paenarthrobacter nitroguajacolicus TaxID=211146 RepID=UPI0015B902C5|nr:hypothetical protein [Paenarthrobacter nitroguajacolicus]NWL32035.1 hypothetical protein [Paenarthrobacter nitroguajacolicus]